MGIKWKPCATTAPEKSGTYLVASASKWQDGKLRIFAVISVDYSVKHATRHGAAVYGWNREDCCEYDIDKRSDFAVDKNGVVNYWTELPELEEVEE